MILISFKYKIKIIYNKHFNLKTLLLFPVILNKIILFEFKHFSQIIHLIELQKYLSHLSIN